MLTPSQQQALDISRHLSVTANAGSGKTMVLVERYIGILLAKKARVTEVVALTFTEKAASELRRKIAEGISLRIAAAEGNARIVLEEIREQLSGAAIGTIHSFCARLLREYPVEAGVDASFSILEGIDQKLMLETAVKQTFESIMRQEQGHEPRARLLDLLRTHGKIKVLDIVNSLALNRERVERWLSPGGMYSKSDDDIISMWNDYLSEYVNAELSDALFLTDLRTVLSAGDQPASGELLRQFEMSGSLAGKLKAFMLVANTSMTRKGTPRRDFFGKGSTERFAQHTTRLHAKRQMLQPLAELFTLGDVLHQTLLQNSRVFLNLYKDVLDRYDRAKADAACVDFEDLQIKTQNLLKDAKTRLKLAQRIKYIMLDEYQDTNRLQYELLHSLVNNLSTVSSGQPQVNLFIVGDPKQSIYGFRNADVTVFNAARSDISRASGPESAIVLNDSFRLLRDIVAFVNLVFSPLMKSDGKGVEVEYEELVQGRQNDSPGRVEVILRRPSDPNATENPASEGELIARRILQLMAEQYQIFGKNDAGHAIAFRDIAVLLRSRNGLAGIEEAFVRRNIPYLVSGGVGYFQTQGIYDFHNYFRFLLNTGDDVALTGILRSPFFTVSDAELFEISVNRKGSSLWRVLQSREKIAQFPSLVRAAETLRQDLLVASRLPVPGLVDRIIEETAYAGFVAGTSRSEQTFANIRKLKRLARGYEGQGFTNLYDFVNRLRRLIEEEEQEGQATIDVLADAVNIMTIHAAKGLEFPVVIVPSLERSFRPDNEPYMDDELGLAFTPLRKNNPDVSVPLTEVLKSRARAKIIAEEKRIFYVACTRARDLLILSGLQGGGRTSPSHLNWLLDGLAVHEDISDDSRMFDLTTKRLVADGNRFTVLSAVHRLTVNILSERDISLAGPVARETPPPALAPRLIIDAVPPGAAGEIFSASKIRTYVECPARYYLRYVAGFPSHGLRSVRDPVDDDDDVQIPADLRGKAFHFVMQHIDRIKPDYDVLVSELRKFVTRDSYSIISEPSVELDELARIVLDVVNSAFWQEVKRGRDERTEFTITASLGSDFLTGMIDRLYCDDRGIWHILDYKTDNIDVGSLDKRTQMYEPQIKFYALLVMKYFSAPNVHGHLLFTSFVDRPAHFQYSKHQLQKHETELAGIVSRIRSRDFLPRESPCAECPFPAGKCNSLMS